MLGQSEIAAKMLRAFLSTACLLVGMTGALLSFVSLLVTGSIANVWGVSWTEKNTGRVTLAVSILAIGIGLVSRKTHSRPSRSETTLSAKLTAEEGKLIKRANDGDL